MNRCFGGEGNGRGRLVGDTLRPPEARAALGHVHEAAGGKAAGRAGEFIAAARSAGYINRGEQCRHQLPEVFPCRRSSHLPDSPSSCWPPMRTLPPLALAGLFAACGGAGRPRLRRRPDRRTDLQAACASCHGASGEGTKDHYHKPLAGDKSAAQLSRLIAESMPKDDPGTCKGADADKVAAYIYGAFYSKSARIALSRLTVRQHQNAIADLISRFRTPGQWDDKRGPARRVFRLPAHESRTSASSTGSIRRSVLTSRTAAPTRRSSRKSSPSAGRVPSSPRTPATTNSSSAARTASGCGSTTRTKPLIDGAVRSGTMVELRESIRLLAGRAYPIRLEFFKSKEAKEKTASVRWSGSRRSAWTGRSRRTTCRRNRFPETLVISAAFPPDDRSLGWERGTTDFQGVGPGRDRRRPRNRRLCDRHLRELSDVREDAEIAGRSSASSAAASPSAAFRRPLTDEQKHLYVDRLFDTAPDPDAAVERVRAAGAAVAALPVSGNRRRRRHYDTASRLSFALWDAPPDQALLDAAAAGQARHARTGGAAGRADAARPGRTPSSASSSTCGFGSTRRRTWPRTRKRPRLRPGCRRRLADFAGPVRWRTRPGTAIPTSAELLLADDLYLNGRLAKFYGADLPADADFQKVKLDSGRRAGVLTHPYLLAAFAHTTATSPIHRGVLLARGVLGLTLHPPPEAFTPLPESLHPDLTTRERVTLQTKPESCQSCHGVINPLGFTLEHFDAVGRLPRPGQRQADRRDGHLQDARRRDGEVRRARPLAEYLAGSDEVQTAFVEQLFRHLAKQPVQAYGPRQVTGCGRRLRRMGSASRSCWWRRRPRRR